MPKIPMFIIGLCLVVPLKTASGLTDFVPDRTVQAQIREVTEWYEARRDAPRVVRLWESSMVPTAVPTRVYTR